MKENSVRMAILFDYYGAALTRKQQEFFDLYHNEDYSLAEIAENAGITRQGVRDIIIRSEAILLDMEQKLGLAEQMSRLNRILGDIRDAADVITMVNDRRYMNAEIRDNAERIRSLCEEGGDNDNGI